MVKMVKTVIVLSLFILEILMVRLLVLQLV
nr:MAG TPA: hypothetical protein [Caudoviricetes sp.]